MNYIPSKIVYLFVFCRVLLINLVFSENKFNDRLSVLKQIESNMSGSPSPSPAIVPTQLVEKTLYPSSIPTLLSNSSAPTIMPSHLNVTNGSLFHPSTFPSTSPTIFPSIKLSASPSSFPSSAPSAAPTSAPTRLSTPGGSSGSTWWYMVSAYCLIEANSFADNDEIEIDLAMEYAFDFILTDRMSSEDRKKLQVYIQREPLGEDQDQLSAISHRPSEIYSFMQLRLNRLQRLRGPNAQPRWLSGETPERRNYAVLTWSPTRSIANIVLSSMKQVQLEPMEIIEPMHEKSIREVSNATISDIHLSVTTKSPMEEPDDTMSPTRIIWIILGTIALFSFIVFSIKSVYLHCYKSPSPRLVHAFSTAKNLVLDAFFNIEKYYHRGFNLTTQEDFDGDDEEVLESFHTHANEADRQRGVELCERYGVSRRSYLDQLNIHASRSKLNYLEDDFEGAFEGDDAAAPAAMMNTKEQFYTPSAKNQLKASTEMAVHDPSIRGRESVNPLVSPDSPGFE